MGSAAVGATAAFIVMPLGAVFSCLGICIRCGTANGDSSDAYRNIAYIRSPYDCLRRSRHDLLFWYVRRLRFFSLLVDQWKRDSGHVPFTRIILAESFSVTMAGLGMVVLVKAHVPQVGTLL